VTKLMAPLAVLLAVECGHQWRARHDPGLAVSDDDVVTGGEGGVRYRLEVFGVNYCCSVRIDVLNVGVESITVRPHAAELTSEKCPVKFLSILYVQGDGARDFKQVDDSFHAKSMASHPPETPLWQELHNPARYFELPRRSFLTLSYFARGEFRKECGAYSFKLPAGGITIAATFTEPK